MCDPRKSVAQFTYKNTGVAYTRRCAGDSFQAATTGRMSSMVKLAVLLIVLLSAGIFLAHAIEAYRDGYLRMFK